MINNLEDVLMCCRLAALHWVSLIEADLLTASAGTVMAQRAKPVILLQ